jgi:hypothetical protein
VGVWAWGSLALFGQKNGRGGRQKTRLETGGGVLLRERWVCFLCKARRHAGTEARRGKTGVARMEGMGDGEYRVPSAKKNELERWFERDGCKLSGGRRLGKGAEATGRESESFASPFGVLFQSGRARRREDVQGWRRGGEQCAGKGRWRQTVGEKRAWRSPFCSEIRGQKSEFRLQAIDLLAVRFLDEFVR